MTESITAQYRTLGKVSALGVFAGGWIWGGILIAQAFLAPPAGGSAPDPFLFLVTVPVILIAPFMIGCMVAVHAYAPDNLKGYGMLALIFMAIASGITSVANFSALMAGYGIGSAAPSWAPVFLPYRWPTVAFAVDTLAWDWFFPLSMFCAAPLFRNGKLETSIRVLMTATGCFSLLALFVFPFSTSLGTVFQVIGWGVLSSFVFLLLAVLFSRAER